MKLYTNNFKKFGFVAVLALFAVGFSFGESYGAAYMKIQGIEGEATDSDHKKWALLDSMSSPLSAEGDSNVVHLTKKVDISSAAISQSAISGKVHERATFDVCERGQECKRYDSSNLVFTRYFITASGDQRPMEEISFVFEKIIQTKKPEPISATEKPTVRDIPASEIVQARVPSWVQTTASFWVDGDVSDREFTDGIGYLVREKIIDVEKPVVSKSSGEPAEPVVPSWIKQNTKWWIEGQVPEDQFLDSIKWLIQNNIIVGVSN